MMPAQEVPLQKLIGKMVVDVDGEAVGRVEDVRAEWKEGDCVVTEYLLGQAGAEARLALSHIFHVVLAASGFGHGRHVSSVIWSLLDISDPEHPTLRCRKGELEK